MYASPNETKTKWFIRWIIGYNFRFSNFFILILFSFLFLLVPFSAVILFLQKNVYSILTARVSAKKIFQQFCPEKKKKLSFWKIYTFLFCAGVLRQDIKRRKSIFSEKIKKIYRKFFATFSIFWRIISIFFSPISFFLCSNFFPRFSSFFFFVHYFQNFIQFVLSSSVNTELKVFIWTSECFQCVSHPFDIHVRFIFIGNKWKKKEKNKTNTTVLKRQIDKSNQQKKRFNVVSF